ncbi:MAG: 23S rRNA (uridine(2479)-2'-O)-methyltransferase [Chlamydiae bacterium]|nr:23S rRNA (uridine(2479)-2'-O)-methyltransferase [Chlamydiota bacterium]
MESGLLSKITSLQNPQVKHLIKLRQKRERDRSGDFVIEGYRELLRALDGKAAIKTLFTCPSLFLGVNESDLIHSFEEQGVVVVECDQNVFEKISYRDRPDGLIAIAKQTTSLLDQLTFKNEAPFVILAVGIEKPGNLGTILRSADAVGADAVFVVDKVTDIYNPNVIRASVGTLFTQPVFQVTSNEIYPWLKQQGIQIVASSPDAQLNYTEANYQLPTAILVGSEQYGLQDHWFKKADLSVSIPMLGCADSLNAATSTTVLLYEVLRQRAHA